MSRAEPVCAEADPATSKCGVADLPKSAPTLVGTRARNPWTRRLVGRFRSPQPVTAAVCEWARDFHLTENDLPPAWIIDQVTASFYQWEMDKVRGRKATMFWGYVGARSPEKVDFRRFEIEFPRFCWNPRLDRTSRSQIREFILDSVKAFPQILESRLDEIEALTLQHYEVIPQKTSMEHFEWAVRFQVNGESVATIAESLENPEVKTVNLGINDVLQQVHLTRRQDKRGPRQKIRKVTAPRNSTT